MSKEVSDWPRGFWMLGHVVGVPDQLVRHERKCACPVLGGCLISVPSLRVLYHGGHVEVDQNKPVRLSADLVHDVVDAYVTM